MKKLDFALIFIIIAHGATFRYVKNATSGNLTPEQQSILNGYSFFYHLSIFFLFGLFLIVIIRKSFAHK